MYIGIFPRLMAPVAASTASTGLSCVGVVMMSLPLLITRQDRCRYRSVLYDVQYDV